MEDATTRNKIQARHIESWLQNQIAMRGTCNVAKAIGVDKSRITRWKETLIPRMSLLLAVLEFGVADDDLARLAKQVAEILTRNKDDPGSGAFSA